MTQPPQLAANPAPIGPRGKHRWPEVLFLVTRAPRTLRDVEDLIGCTRQTVQEVFDRLEEEGLVERSKRKRNSGAWSYQWSWIGPAVPNLETVPSVILPEDVLGEQTLQEAA